MRMLMLLRARIVGSDPEIWRLIVVDPRFTLEQLHTVLQHAFGWTNSHLHQFRQKDGARYAIPSKYDDYDDDSIDERKVCLADVLTRPRTTIAYEYDFGDSWMHEVRFEAMVDGETIEYPFETWVKAGRGVFSGRERAVVCLAGERNGPPEDSGGVDGYAELLELRRHPPHPTARTDADARERLLWLGDWDPEHVDLAEINQMHGRMRLKKAMLGRLQP